MGGPSHGPVPAGSACCWWHVGLTPGRGSPAPGLPGVRGSTVQADRSCDRGEARSGQGRGRGGTRRPVRAACPGDAPGAPTGKRLFWATWPPNCWFCLLSSKTVWRGNKTTGPVRHVAGRLYLCVPPGPACGDLWGSGQGPGVGDTVGRQCPGPSTCSSGESGRCRCAGKPVPQTWDPGVSPKERPAVWVDLPSCPRRPLLGPCPRHAPYPAGHTGRALGVLDCNSPSELRPPGPAGVSVPHRLPFRGFHGVPQGAYPCCS